MTGRRLDLEDLEVEVLAAIVSQHGYLSKFKPIWVEVLLKHGMLLKSVLLKSRNLVEMASMELFHRQPLVEKVGGAQQPNFARNMMQHSNSKYGRSRNHTKDRTSTEF